ncbi:uncharacterized protein LOC132172879 [Corylus avellana]|uniref:uncharacterized protein LOC132172879 n=1 Tax=Corylus avellana TaxID=13451 RepID=UPI001E218453|nr:uncharacterized protein LOC132172879 [Corylus avellana]
MAFRWLLHSACHVIGLPKDTTKLDTNEDHRVISSLKVSNNGGLEKHPSSSGFQMPLHYPRYKKTDYEKMEEWKVELLLKQYGLSFEGTLDEKRAYAMGAFLWPDQY